MTESVSRQNVGDAERWASAITGGALALYGLSRMSVGGALAALLGGSLFYRGVTGNCPVYRALDIDTAKQRPTQLQDAAVEAASEDSFPASDAPAWTPTTSVGELAR
jgi:uncharacterized membrane protein